MTRMTNEMLCRALFLQAAYEGRGETLFGSGWNRTFDALVPFVKDVSFPLLYPEFPLNGEPFLDVTALYSDIKTGTRFDSAARSLFSLSG